jgi:peptide/nickel transport system substrate-binding protein
MVSVAAGVVGWVVQRVGVTLLVGFALALVVLGLASAGTPAPARYGGVLVVALTNGDPASIDPTLSVSIPATEIYRAMCDPLYIRGGLLERVPVLAAGQPVASSDKLTYTVQLRKGIEFNDGTPFDAQAVVASIQRFETYPGSALVNDYANLDNVTAPGPYTLIFHLKQRDSTFFSGDRNYVLSPTAVAKEGAGFSAAPVCVGPFMFDHRVVGDNITLIKSPYYYNRKDIFLDKVVFKPIGDAAAAEAALEAGDVQAIDNVPTTELPTVQESSSLRVLRAPQMGWTGVVINIGNKNGGTSLPYQDVGTPLAQSPQLRQAFEEAINRTLLNKVVFGGLYVPSCTLIPPADTPWFNLIKVPCTPYDPAGARKLVASSGIPNPTVHLMVRTNLDRLLLAQFIQAQEKAVGINVVLDVTDNVTEGAQRSSGSFDADVFASAVPGDPAFSFTARFTTGTSSNVSGYSNPRLDFVLANGVKAAQPKARAVYYHVAQQIIHDARPVIVLYDTVTFAAYSTKVTGLELTTSGVLIVRNARLT